MLQVGKHDCLDWAATDLVFKRSLDGGATWSPLAVVYSNRWAVGRGGWVGDFYNMQHHV